MRPLLIVHTGEGKGKTTAAMGLALRGWAQGWSIGVVQFVKSGRWPSGEKVALLELGRVHEASHELGGPALGGPVAWYQAGSGRTAYRSANGDRAIDAQEAAAYGWVTARGLLADATHGLLVLDELTYPLAKGWIPRDEVIAVLRDRPDHQHVVVTGRGAPPELVALADLVTDMGKVRHPFDAGIRGQRGIEW